MKKTIFIAIRTAMIFTFLVQSTSALAQSKKAGHEASKTTPKLEPWEAWEKFREPMATISRQLGVTCTHCHDTRNYRDASKKAHSIAKSHMEMVDTINDKYKNSFSAKIDCYVCHQGKAKPNFIEKKAKF